MRRLGLYGRAYCTCPNDPHSEKNIMRLIEKGRVSLQGKAGIVLLRKLRREETLALMVDAFDYAGAMQLIALAYHRIGRTDATADSLNVPKVAVWAVVFGTFPAPEGLG